MQKIEKDLKRIYRKYKQQILPTALFFASVIILSRIVMPQLTAISDINVLIDREKQDIKQSEVALSLLSTTPSNILEENYQIATSVLPLQKDIGLIFSGLNDAADRASVELGKFSFRVGGVFDSKKQIKGDKTIEGIPYLAIEVQAKGNNVNLKNYVETLYTSMPIVDIDSVQIREGVGKYSLKMFFKQMDAKSAEKVNGINNLTASESKVLEQLKSWKTFKP